MAWNPQRGPTVLEDFEDGIDESNWSGTSFWGVVQDSSLEGSQLAQSTGANTRFTYDLGSTTRGNYYRCRYIDASAGGDVWFLVGSQGGIDNTYATLVEPDDDRFRILKQDGGSVSAIDADGTVTLSTNTEYRVRFKYGPVGQSNNIEATLYDANDSVISSVGGTDDTHTGGTWGWYSGANADDKVDYVTEESI